MKTFFVRERTEKATATVSRGKRGNGGAPFEYRLDVFDGVQGIQKYIDFQQGNMDQNINGVLGDQLIAVVIDRLEYFQEGPFACHHNAMMLNHLRQALAWSDERQRERRSRSVAGELKP